MRSTRRSYCSRIRGSDRAPPGHSSSTSRERSNAVLAVSRCPASSSFRPVSKCWSDLAIRSATGSDFGTGAGSGACPTVWTGAGCGAWAHFLLPAHPTANSAMRHTPHDRPRREVGMASTYSSIRLIHWSKARAHCHAGLCRTMSARPAGLLEDLLRFAEVSRRGRDDRPLANEQLLARPKRRPYVILTNELGRVIGSRRRATILSSRDRLVLGGFVATRREEAVDSRGQGV